jgi:WD40 repeat protein
MAVQVHPEFYLNAETKVTSLAFFQDSKKILAGTSIGTIQLWDLKSQLLERTLQTFGNDEPVLWISLINSADDNKEILVQARFSRTVQILRGSDLQVCRKIDILQAVSHFCKGDICESTLAIPFGENSVQLLNNYSKKSSNHQSKTNEEGSLTALKLAKSRLFLAFESGNVTVFNIDNYDDLKCLTVINLTSCALSLDFDASKRIMVCCGPEDFIISLDIKDDELRLLKKRDLPTKGLSCVHIRKSDAKIVVAGSWDGTVRLFSWLKPQTLKPLGALKFHEESVDALALDGGSIIAAGSSDGYISFWNVYPLPE